jgi:hypothetical protein
MSNVWDPPQSSRERHRHAHEATAGEYNIWPHSAQQAVGLQYAKHCAKHITNIQQLRLHVKQLSPALSAIAPQFTRPNRIDNIYSLFLLHNI